MTPRLLSGASYVDALPSGAYVALHEGSHLETHLGRIELPPGESFGLMFLRCSDVGGFHVAGKGHDSGQTWEWRGTWRTLATVTGRGCYDRAGQFRDTLPAGYQYTGDDGAPVSRIDTYPPRDGIELSEWTETAGVRIGQGHEGGGVRVFVDGVLREIEPGNCWFVNVNRASEQIAISFWKVGLGAVIVQTTLGELRALPPIVTPPAPPPVQEPPPMKKCEVTVDAFTLTSAAQLRDGTVMQFHDRENPSGAHVRVWVENGSCRMSIDYPGAGTGLKGETGARRPVR